MSDEEVQKNDESYVEDVVKKLMLHFDAVQVFVTRQEPDGRTMAYSSGRGNFYSRAGVINEWCSRGGGVGDVCPEEDHEDHGDGEPPATT